MNQLDQELLPEYFDANFSESDIEVFLESSNFVARFTQNRPILIII